MSSISTVCSIRSVMVTKFRHRAQHSRAFLIGFVGWLVGKILAGLVTNILASAGADQGAHRLGLDPTLRISRIIGTIVLIFVFVPALIAARRANIEAISDPRPTCWASCSQLFRHCRRSTDSRCHVLRRRFAAALLGRLLNVWVSTRCRRNGIAFLPAACDRHSWYR
jgi:hypothetical protein